MTELSSTCPVCGVAEKAGVPSLECHKMYIHFCSEQCRVTFIAHPRLYGSMVGKERKKLLNDEQFVWLSPLILSPVIGFHTPHGGGGWTFIS